MILDVCTECEKYEALVPGISKAIAEVMSLEKWNPGRYPLDSGYYIIQKGVTVRPDGPFETHQRYLDVQVVLDGSEQLYWANRETVRETTPYDPERDFRLLSGEGIGMRISPGMFYVMGPNDAHRCCCDPDGACEYVKAVIKIPQGLLPDQSAGKPA